MCSRTVGIVWGTVGVMAVTLLGCSGPHVVSNVSTPTPVSLWPGISFQGLGPVLICVDHAPTTQHAGQNVAGGVGVARSDRSGPGGTSPCLGLSWRHLDFLAWGQEQSRGNMKGGEGLDVPLALTFPGSLPVSYSTHLLDWLVTRDPFHSSLVPRAAERLGYGSPPLWPLPCLIPHSPVYCPQGSFAAPRLGGKTRKGGRRPARQRLRLPFPPPSHTLTGPPLRGRSCSVTHSGHPHSSTPGRLPPHHSKKGEHSKVFLWIVSVF